MKELFYNNGKCYIIIRKLPVHEVSTRKGVIIPDLFNAWKEHLGADHVLKVENVFLYCESITDVEYETITDAE